MRLVNVCLAVLLCLSPRSGGAYYTYENFFSVPHEPPAWFLMDNYGGFYGETIGGHAFSQKPITNDFGIRLHKFSIGTAFFYVSDRGVIAAESDVKALSIYFGRV